jgi:hypothetical protein
VALGASCELAIQKHVAFPETRAAEGVFTSLEHVPENTVRMGCSSRKIRRTAFATLMIAIADGDDRFIAGCYECIEPQVSNFQTRNTKRFCSSEQISGEGAERIGPLDRRDP